MGPRKTKEAMKLYETYILILITNALATFFLGGVVDLVVELLKHLWILVPEKHPI